MKKGPLAVWSSIAVAAVVAILSIAAVDLLQVPFRFYRSTPWHLPRMLLLCIDGCLHHFRYQLFFLAWIAAMYTAFCNAGRFRPAHLGLNALLSGGIALYGYGVLTDYVNFRGQPLFIGAFVLLWILVFAWTAAFRRQPPREEHGFRRRLFWYGLPAGFVAGGATLLLLNLKLYAGIYPTLHLSALQVSFLLLTGGLALALNRFPRPSFPSGWVNWTVIAAAATLLFAASVTAEHPWTARSKTLFHRFTVIGQSHVVARNLLQELAMTRMGVESEERGVELFARHSGLPELPEDFSLGDYNVLLVTVESLRFDQTSLADMALGTTPALRRAADGGMFSFTDAYSPTMKTMNVLASIMTMTYPSFVKTWLTRNPAFGRLDESETTVAEHFQQAGYGTFRISHNFARVFDRLIHGFDRGFDFDRLLCSSPNDPDCDAEILEEAIEALDRFGTGDRRFFGWVFFVSPHAPYLKHYDDMPARTEMDLFRQEIRFADEQMGKLLDHLAALDLMKDTVVIIMGDHGEEFEEHGKTGHNSIYRVATNVAMVVHIPGMEGRRMEKPTSTTYLFPWLFQTDPAFEAAATRRMRTDFGPVMRETNGAVVSELISRDRAQVALAWKWHRILYDHASGHYELFDLEEDPGEQRDIFDESTLLSRESKAAVQAYLRIQNARFRIRFSQTEPPEKRARQKAQRKDGGDEARNGNGSGS